MNKDIFSAGMSLASKAFFSLLFASFFVLPLAVSAASLSVKGPQSVEIGQAAEFDVLIDSGGVPINAVEGTFAYPDNLLFLKSVSTDESPVDFWVVEPVAPKGAATSTDGMQRVQWSGIIPGGWNGVRSAFYDGEKPGILFKLFFIAKVSGNPAITFENLDARLNDGNGTPVVFTAEPTAISASGSGTYSPEFPSEENSATSTGEYSTGKDSVMQGILIGAAIVFVLGLAIFYGKKRKQS